MKILNVSEDETVPHRLLLIDGVTDIPAKCQIEISSEHCGIVSQTDKSGRFRILISLQNGENKSFIRNQRDSTDMISITVFYRPPTFSEHFRLLFVVPADQNHSISPTNLQQKISLGAEILQSFVAEELRRHCGRRLTFRLEEAERKNGLEIDDSTSTVKCRLLLSKKTKDELRNLPPIDLYWTLVDEIFKSDHYDSAAKYLVFLSFVDTNGDQIDIGANLGCGDVALINAAGLWCWPDEWKDVQNTLNCTDPISDAIPAELSRGHSTIGGFYGATMGATLHELCHALDLAHSESGVMGRDFAYLGTRLVCPQNGIEEDCGSCQLDIGQLALLRHHRWLHGLPKSAVEITVRNGCIICPDGIAVAALRKDGFSVFVWRFDIYKPTIWRPPEDVMKLLTMRSNIEKCCDIALFVLSAKGVTTRVLKM